MDTMLDDWQGKNYITYKGLWQCLWESWYSVISTYNTCDVKPSCIKPTRFIISAVRRLRDFRNKKLIYK